MAHQHKYDANGKRICCTEEEKIYVDAGAGKLINKPKIKNDKKETIDRISNTTKEISIGITTGAINTTKN